MWVTPAITASRSIGVLISRSQPLLKAGPDSHGSHRITASPIAIFTQVWLISVTWSVIRFRSISPVLPAGDLCSSLYSTPWPLDNCSHRRSERWNRLSFQELSLHGSRMSDALQLQEPTRSAQSAGAPRRTVAIISHPDAGKTTLTEKLLYFGGAIQMAGQVKARGDRRRTRSDWLEIERARGISVTSSVMTFEYDGIVFNLLDTPGHADFSEDTYRTLSAVDAAVMVIDAAKGIESQTRKLFEVCRLRDIPIITFINKIDREGQDPLALLDEISSGLALDLTVLTWPVGMGVDFRGLLDIEGAKLLLPKEARTDSFGRTEQLETIQALSSYAGIEERISRPALESLELCLSDLPPLHAKAFLEGHLSPVIFGSALKDFGVAELLACLRSEERRVG